MGSGHRRSKFGKKQGVFEKSENYRTECKSCRYGYHSGFWQAHHVLPGVTLSKDTLEKQVNNAKAEYIENCKWITPWNLNETYNLMGLPTIWDYILAEKIKKNINEGGIPLSKYRSNKIKALLKKIISKVEIFEAPKDLPVHNPVSWGHVNFNKEVCDVIKRYIWDALDEKKEEHKINPEDIKIKLDKAASHFRTKLIERGGREGGTEKNWPKRFESGNTSWYHPFSMARKPKNPL